MRRRQLVGVSVWLFAAAGAPSVAQADVRSDAQGIVGAADKFIRRMRAGKSGKKVTNLLGASRGALVLPDIIRAGLMVGGETGNGVLLARDPSRGWSNPVFVNSSSASYGFQAGVKRYHALMIVMKENAIKQMAEFGAQFGTHMSLAGGDKGYDGSIINTTDVLSDAYTFFETDFGLFGGGSMEGTALTPRQDINDAVFGKGVKAQDVLFTDKFPPRPGAKKLIEALTVK